VYVMCVYHIVCVPEVYLVYVFRTLVVPVPNEEFVRMAGVLEVRRLMPGYIRLEGEATRR
jgi:hypothetical protein